MPPPDEPPGSVSWQLRLRGQAVQRRWRAVCDAAVARQDARIAVATAARTAAPVPSPAPTTSGTGATGSRPTPAAGGLS